MNGGAATAVVGPAEGMRQKPFAPRRKILHNSLQRVHAGQAWFEVLPNPVDK